MFGDKKFIEKNAVNPALAKYLGFGAIMLTMNRVPTETMAVRMKNSQIQRILCDFWDINNRESCLSTLDWLAHSGHVEDKEEAYIKYKEGHHVAMSSSIKNELGRLAEISINYKFNVEDANKNRTILAFDLERLAFLARLGQQVGYITQDEAWHQLQDIVYPKAKSAFKTWSEYGMSFLQGRAFCYDDDIVPGALGVWTLLVDKKATSIWSKYPLENM